MRTFRKPLLMVLPVAGFVLFVGAHSANDHVPVALACSGLSLLFFLATLVLAIVPERRMRRTPSPEPKPPARVLPRDVLNNPGFPLSLPQRIEAAIELSRLEARTLGILSIHIDGTDALARACDALRASLRATDRAIIAGDGEILVCLPLILVRSDLDAVAARLSRVLANALARPDEIAGATPTIDVGIAMYPIDGLRAADLIEAAQAHAAAIRDLRYGRRPARRTGNPMPVLLPPSMTRADAMAR